METHDPAAFRGALLGVAPRERDAWVDRFLGIDAIADDGPDLPRDAVPYLPCPVDALIRAVDDAAIAASDVVVDVGAGIGRATALVHLLTGATAIGIEIQRGLARAARDLATRVGLPRVTTIEGDASAIAGSIASATVFFLYCPFSGARLERFLGAIEPLARARALRVVTVDLPLPSRPWLALAPQSRGDLAVHRTTLHELR